MKLSSLIILCVFFIIVYSCKKAPKSSNSNNLVWCKLDNKIESTTDFQDTSYYTYNLLNKVSKIIYHQSSFIDSIEYNTSGKIGIVKNYQNSILKSTTNFFYSGNNLISVYTPGVESILFKYSVGSNLPDSIFSSYYIPEESDIVSIINMVWFNGNVVSAKFITGHGEVWDVSIISDNKKNRKRFDIPKTIIDFLYSFNRNNIVSMSLVNEETDGVNVFPAGTIIFENIFSYTLNNEVSAIQESINYFNGQEKTTTCTYNCQ